MGLLITIPQIKQVIINIDNWETAVKLYRVLKQFGFKTKGKFKKSHFTGKIAMDINKYDFAQVNKNYKFYGVQTVVNLMTIESVDLLIPDLRLIMEENIKAYKAKSIEDQFKQFIDKPTKIVKNNEDNADYWYAKAGWWSTK